MAAPRTRWVQKAPSHLSRLPVLFETYPDARVVITHRDPLRLLHDPRSPGSRPEASAPRTGLPCRHRAKRIWVTLIIQVLILEVIKDLFGKHLHAPLC